VSGNQSVEREPSPHAGERAGLYVHVPFCARACPYCDFDFEVGGDPRRIEAWLDGLERERVSRAAELERVELDTVYIGGGTPSVLTPEQLRRLSVWLRERLGVDPSALREFSVELNPEHVSPELLDTLVEIGVDRVSLGVQSLVPEGLRALGRVHAAAQARASVLACVARGLRTSADLIVGWPGHTDEALRGELDELLDAGVEHLSIYALTIEPDTPWPKLVRRGLRVLPDEDEQAERLLAAEQHLCARGLLHYEVASYARPGAEALHNGKYWRFVDVVGFGPSAASVRHELAARGLGVVERRVNVRGLAAWLNDPASPEQERLEGDRAAAEGLWLGLRQLGGLDVARYLERFAVDRSWFQARIARQLELGNLQLREGGAVLAVAPGRWLWHDSIAVDLL
jgi:oxygen-independent coproporphyrinogen-3 oxidase